MWSQVMLSIWALYKMMFDLRSEFEKLVLTQLSLFHAQGLWFAAVCREGMNS